MQQRAISLFRLSLQFVFLLALGALATGVVTAQPRRDLPEAGSIALEKEYEKYRPAAQKVMKGETTYNPDDAEQKKALDCAARFAMYRFTWQTNESPGKMEAVHEDNDKQLRWLYKDKKLNHPAAGAYTRLMVKYGKEVLNTCPQKIARVNAARALARLAELGQGELADALVEIINQEVARDAKPGEEIGRNDGVKYYALRGLHDLLALPPQTPPVWTPDREKKVAEALLTFVNRPATFPKETPRDEVEGFQALRREAVRALALCRAPGLKTKDRPGMTLLRMTAGDGFTPEPRFDERVEAAVGVARMRPAADGPEYQPAYAAYQIALLVKDLASQYSNPERMTRPPFRIYAARLLEALDAMKAEVNNPQANVAIDESRRVLLKIEAADTAKPADITREFGALAQWLQGNASQEKGLFKGVAGTEVKPPAQP